MIRQYRVTYESDNETSIVQREAYELPDMEFRMHKLGLYVFYLEDIKNLVLIKHVRRKNEGIYQM